MSEKVNVLTVVAQDAYDANQYRGVIGAAKLARERQKAESAVAKDAITELLEASRELIAAQAHYDAIDFPGGARLDRLSAARERHAAAVAAMGAGDV